MQYIHKYLTTSAFNEDWNGSYKEPWVSLNKENGIITFNWAPDTNEKSYVDLGLPSGNLWATSNHNSNKYYKWGELNPKTDGTWSTYSYGTSADNLSRYTEEDGLTMLGREDDVICQDWEGDWCIPTQADFDELFENTTIIGTYNTYIRLKSNINGAWIILYKYGSPSTGGSGVYGYYWCSTLDPNDKSKAAHAVISDSTKFTSTSPRCCAFSIRPVIRRLNQPQYLFDD